MLKTINKYKYIISIICFVILTIPKFYEVFPIFHSIVNCFKILCIIWSGYMLFDKQKKIDIISILFIIYFSFLFFSTIINCQNILNFIKSYIMIFVYIIFFDEIFTNKDRYKYIKFIGFYFAILIIINFACIFLGCILNNYAYTLFNTYFLGQDNRFILYFIPCLICLYLIYLNESDKKYLYLFIYIYLMCLFTLFILWSVSAFLVLLLIGLLFLIKKYFFIIKNKNKYNYIICFIVIINILLVFFKLTSYIQPIIVNVLHKNSTLSYRTVLWDNGIKMLLHNPLNIIYGFGYYDISNAIPIYIDGTGVPHLHNFLLNTLFFSGIIGLALYAYIYIVIIKKINLFKNNTVKHFSFSFMIPLLILLTFDTFELYSMYFLIIYLLYFFDSFIKKSKVKK